MHGVHALAAIAAPIVVGRGATFVGKALFKAVLKSFPGANLAVGVVAAGVAGLVTEALGEAWSQLPEHCYTPLQYPF